MSRCHICDGLPMEDFGAICDCWEYDREFQSRRHDELFRLLHVPTLGPEVREAWMAFMEEIGNDRRVLRQIADPSYVGNYDAETVVNIYRSWAHNALVAEC